MEGGRREDGGGTEGGSVVVDGGGESRVMIWHNDAAVCFDIHNCNIMSCANIADITKPLWLSGCACHIMYYVIHYIRSNVRICLCAFIFTLI